MCDAVPVEEAQKRQSVNHRLSFVFVCIDHFPTKILIVEMEESAESYGTIPTASQKSDDDGGDIYKDIPAKWAPSGWLALN